MGCKSESDLGAAALCISPYVRLSGMHMQGGEKRASPYKVLPLLRVSEQLCPRSPHGRGASIPESSPLTKGLGVYIGFGGAPLARDLGMPTLGLGCSDRVLPQLRF